MIEEYDGSKLHIEKLSGSSWVEIKTATMSYSFDMPENDNDVLIYGTETATLNLTRYAKSFTPPTEPGDRVRLRYGSYVWPRIFYVDKASTEWFRGPADMPKYLTYVFQATLVGVYATTLARIVSYPDLPKESAYKRMSRFVNIRNLSILDSESEVDA